MQCVYRQGPGKGVQCTDKARRGKDMCQPHIDYIAEVSSSPRGGRSGPVGGALGVRGGAEEPRGGAPEPRGGAEEAR